MAYLYIDKIDIASRAAWFYVLLTKAPVEIFEFNSKNEQMALDNPMNIKPLLVDGMIRLWGSQAVILYIAEKYTNFEGFGKTVEERAKTESILSWANGSLYRSVAVEFVAPQLFEEEALEGELKLAQVESGKKATHEQLTALEKSYLQKSKFISGEKPGFLDFNVGIILSVLDKVNFDFTEWPKTKQWFTQMRLKSQEMIRRFQEHEGQSSKQG